MKTLTLMLAVVAFATAAQAQDDYLGISKMYLRDLERHIAVAKEKTDAPSAWQQCELTLGGLEGAVAKLPEAESAPFLAKIKLYKPAIVAGAARNRASNLARRMRGMLESARADIAAGNNKPANLQEAYYGKLDQNFAEEDLKSLPADELTKLKADYAEVKRLATAK